MIKIKDSEWFKKTHEGMSISDDEKVDDANYCSDCINKKGCINCVNGDMKETEYKVKPKFHEGDWIIDNKNRVGIIVRILDGHYIISFDGREVQIPFEWEGKLFRKWTIQDAKDGDVLKEDSCTFIIERMKPDGTAIIHCCLFDDGDFDLGSTLGFDVDSTYPATKEQREKKKKKMHDAGYEWDAGKKELKKISQHMVSAEAKEALYDKPAWSEEDKDATGMAIIALEDMYDEDAPNTTYGGYNLPFNKAAERLKSLKDRVIPQSKQEWSEEDKKMFVNIKAYLRNADKDYSKELDWLKSLRPQKPTKWSEDDETGWTNTMIMIKEVASNHYTKDSIRLVIDWLKSLKERYTWKPSDEQIKALHDLNLTGNISYAGQGQTLIELYNDLKKITEE